MTTFDWLYVGFSLLLALCAFAAPYTVQLMIRKALAPKLEMQFELRPPWSRQTKRRGGDPVYYFRFSVTNQGKSQTRHCEAVLQRLWTCDSSGTAFKEEDFSPVRLKWVEEGGEERVEDQGTPFIEINPHRPPVYCAIGHVSSPLWQLDERERAVNLLGRGEDDLLFYFELMKSYYAQPDCLPPGRFVFKVGVCSENADKAEQCFDVSWSGLWRETEEEMFRQLVITRVSEPKASA